MLVHRWDTLSIEFTGTARVKWLAQEHCTTVFLGRAGTQTTRSRVEWTDHETTVPPLINLTQANSVQHVNELTSKLALRNIPAYDNVQSLLLSKGGAQLLHIACMAGNVTPYSQQK